MLQSCDYIRIDSRGITFLESNIQYWRWVTALPPLLSQREANALCGTALAEATLIFTRTKAADGRQR